MKKQLKLMCCILALLGFVLLLTGCGSSDEPSEADTSDNQTGSESGKKADEPNEEGDVLDSSTESEETTPEDSDGTSSNSKEASNENSSNTPERKENNDSLAEYSAEEIEYARVWLQLGPNQEIDELNVHRIPAGELINPNDETSAVYPEDVIQLAGSRLVDGSVTYSSNGDGTINVYNVPLRWDGNAEVDENFMKEYTEGIIKDAEEVYVEPGDAEKVKRLIRIMKIH
ncbi:hypothetical protein [Sediminibacillus halophilus]|uniref:Lipoprotein n=1 Tax=Sediminibacillus halophilus TaxID=482461 RepID=A0A1G9T9I5_9BACI|nr:hypothetical protein [Sediminibacillus halophilus]SDM44262.1 hypothetical protein SAMN05216244_2492 [Sediminibacillus halophilus]